jgi:cytochrome c-type biogenesis protein CcmH/NrfF
MSGHWLKLPGNRSLHLTLYGLLIAYCVLLFSLLTAAPAHAQSPTPVPVDPATISDDAVNAIAKEMFCPVCENTPLAS